MLPGVGDDVAGASVMVCGVGEGSSLAGGGDGECTGCELTEGIERPRGWTGSAGVLNLWAATENPAHAMATAKPNPPSAYTMINHQRRMLVTVVPRGIRPG